MKRLWYVRWGVGHRNVKRFKYREAALEAARKIANETGRPVEFGVGDRYVYDVLPERREEQKDG